MRVTQSRRAVPVESHPADLHHYAVCNDWLANAKQNQKLLAKSIKNGKMCDEMVDGDHLTTGAVVLLGALKMYI